MNRVRGRRRCESSCEEVGRGLEASSEVIKRDIVVIIQVKSLTVNFIFIFFLQ
jgi:hypothetical protein